MKKLLIVVLTLAMALSLSVTAFAKDTVIGPNGSGSPDSTTGNTAVSFEVDPAYTVTIPATVELVKTGTDTVTYEKDMDITAAAGVRLLEGQSIQVKLTSDFSLKTAASATYQLPYTVKVGDGSDAVSSGDVVATFGTSAEAQTSTLHFAAGNPTYAGDYSDPVTFTISVVDAATRN